MAIPRRAPLDRPVRKALVDAAVREFTEQGYDGASLNRILKSARLSKGQFYYHYRGKAGLLRSLIEEMTEGIRSEVGTLGPPPPTVEGFWAQLEGAYAAAIRYFVERPREAALGQLLTRVYMHPDLAGDLAEVRYASQAFLLEKVEQGRKVGAVRDDLPATYVVAVTLAILEATDVWAAGAWKDLGPEGLERIPSMVVGIIRRMVTPGTPSVRPPGRRPIGGG